MIWLKRVATFDGDRGQEWDNVMCGSLLSFELVEAFEMFCFKMHMESERYGKYTQHVVADCCIVERS